MRRRSSGPTLSTTSFASADSTTPSIDLPPAQRQHDGAGVARPAHAAAGRSRRERQGEGQEQGGGGAWGSGDSVHPTNAGRHPASAAEIPARLVAAAAAATALRPRRWQGRPRQDRSRPGNASETIVPSRTVLGNELVDEEVSCPVRPAARYRGTPAGSAGTPGRRRGRARGRGRGWGSCRTSAGSVFSSSAARVRAARWRCGSVSFR